MTEPTEKYTPKYARTKSCAYEFVPRDLTLAEIQDCEENHRECQPWMHLAMDSLKLTEAKQNDAIMRMLTYTSIFAVGAASLFALKRRGSILKHKLLLTPSKYPF